MREKSKNTMRSAEEKERIVLESFKEGRNKTANKYDILDISDAIWSRHVHEYRICLLFYYDLP